MNYRIDRPGRETHDVFGVVQFAAGTFLDDLLGADEIRIDAHATSEIHRHNQSQNVIYITAGEATIILDDEEFAVSEGDRIAIGPGVYHGFRTADRPLRFVSIQIPPILDKKRGVFDREIRPHPSRP